MLKGEVLFGQICPYGVGERQWGVVGSHSCLFLPVGCLGRVQSRIASRAKKTDTDTAGHARDLDIPRHWLKITRQQFPIISEPIREYPRTADHKHGSGRGGGPGNRIKLSVGTIGGENEHILDLEMDDFALAKFS